MVSSMLKVGPENFNVLGKTPEDEEHPVLGEDFPIRAPMHLESALPADLARQVVEETVLLTSLTRAAPSKLTVEDGVKSTSVELTLRVELRGADGFRIETADSTQDMEFVLDIGTEGQATLNLDVRYTGLPVEKALTYARFMNALHSDQGALSVVRGDPVEKKIPLLELPLPLDSAAKEDARQTLRFAEVLEEVGRMTGTEFVYPAEIDEQDLKNLNHVLAVVRGGWVALPVKDFTTPMGADGVQNVLDMVGEEGDVLKAFAMTSEGEMVKILDAWVDLGPSIRYVSGARLITSRSELERWLSEENKPEDSFAVQWAPVDEARVHVFYQEWPKPSSGARREDLQAFEDEYGISSEEFRRARRAGEQWAQELEGGDVWLTLLDAQEHFSHLSQEA